MELITLKEWRETGELIAIYELMNYFEETDRKDLILKKKWEACILGDTRNIAKGICWMTKKYRSIDTER